MSPVFFQSIDRAPYASVVVGESGTILFANRQVGHLFGYAPGELHGQSIELLMPERFRLLHIGHRLRFTDDRRTRPMGAGRADEEALIIREGKTDAAVRRIPIHLSSHECTGFKDECSTASTAHPRAARAPPTRD